MSKEAKFKMDSDRNIRNGFMGLCVRLANQLNSKTENNGINESDLGIINYLDKIEFWFNQPFFNLILYESSLICYKLILKLIN